VDNGLDIYVWFAILVITVDSFVNYGLNLRVKGEGLTILWAFSLFDIVLVWTRARSFMK